jgi:hypothetical protein
LIQLSLLRLKLRLKLKLLLNNKLLEALLPPLHQLKLLPSMLLPKLKLMHKLLQKHKLLLQLKKPLLLLQLLPNHQPLLLRKLQSQIAQISIKPPLSLLPPPNSCQTISHGPR